MGSDIDEHRTPRRFWAEAINTACYLSNWIFLRSILNVTSYELALGGSHLFLKRGNLDKFESRFFYARFSM